MHRGGIRTEQRCILRYSARTIPTSIPRETRSLNSNPPWEVNWQSGLRARHRAVRRNGDDTDRSPIAGENW